MLRQIRFTLPGMLLFALSIGLVPADARAAIFCVDNANGLTGALAAAQILPESNEIRIQEGTYLLPGGTGGNSSEIGFHVYTHNLIISGGWFSGCTLRSPDPTATTINGQGSSGSSWNLSSNASITLDGLRFVNSHWVTLIDDFECTASGRKFTVRRAVFDGSLARALRLIADCHNVRLENNLVVNSQDDGILMICGGSTTYQLINNTVRDSSDLGLDLFLAPKNPCVLNNGTGVNGLYNNLIDKVLLDDATPLARNNIFDQLITTGSGGLFPGSSDNPIADPQLDSDYRPIEPGSPAINSGTDNVPGGLPGTDIEGGPRVVGGTPDRGAFESSVVPPGPFVLTVTSAADSGSGTLRDILDQANANAGLNLIQFDISGDCPRIITLSSPLPNVTEPVIVNGYSQPGASFNSLEHGNNSVLCVGIRASQLVDVPYALRVPPNSGAALKVRGIGFGGFDSGGGLLGEAAIFLQGGSGHEVQGSQFGGAFHATTLPVSSESVRLMNNATGALIGGSSPSLRNTFSGASVAAIHIIGSVSGNHEIVNNYIGTTPSGLSAAGNLDGIRIIQSADNQVLDNLISGNTRDGIYISGEQATGNVIGGNRIGDRRGGFYPCGIDPFPPCQVLTNRKGVFIDNDAGDNLIGQATSTGASNRIRYSTQHGVRVLSGQQNRIWGNSIFDSGSEANELDIDLGNFGLDPIDADCGAAADAKANRGQNRPVLGAAEASGGQLSVSGELSSCTHNAGFDAIYRLEFFASPDCAANGHGPGRYFLGVSNVFLPGDPQTEQTAGFEAELEHPWLNLAGMAITATANDLFGNTSEFSQCVTATQADVIFSDRFELASP